MQPKKEAACFAEFYTGDIEDISSEDKKKANFSIKEIGAGMNEALEIEEIAND